MNWLSIIQQTLLITSFVVMMMLLIEFVNVWTKGRFTDKIRKTKGSQVLIGVLLGLLPGCMGAFTVVSLYTHGVISFGALVAAMIATSGDEAYFMFALIPDKVWIIFGVMTVAAIVTGLLTDKILGRFMPGRLKTFKFQIHRNKCTISDVKLFSLKNFKFSVKRMILMIGLIFTVIGASLGWIMHAHGHNILFKLPESVQKMADNSGVDFNTCAHDHNHDHSHSHDHDKCSNSDEAKHSKNGLNIDWIALSIILIALICLLIVIFSGEHFVEIHLWKHLIIKHLPKILLWTAGIMIILNLVFTYYDFGEWIYDNMWLVLFIALIIGIIPESGPHLLFLVLFAYGQIPLSILIASSIVQDGHGSLPLLAESKRSFFAMKAINIVVGFIIGGSGLLLGY